MVEERFSIFCNGLRLIFYFLIAWQAGFKLQQKIKRCLISIILQISYTI